MSPKSAALDWPGLMRVGMGPVRHGGLGLQPEQFWALSPAELALMLGIDPGDGVMTRARMAQLLARYPDGPLGTDNQEKGDADGS